MPIFEFRCLKCNECFEFLVMNRDLPVELKCPRCDSEDFERVLSASCHTIGDGSAKGGGPMSHTRTCSSGSCTTYDIPGPSR
jgi:putative FmdB family regulatory protein